MTVELRRLSVDEWASTPKPEKKRIRAPHSEERLAKQRAYNAANPDKIAAYGRRLKERDPEIWRLARNARARVHKATARGLLVRPDLCSRCGQPGRRIEAAHHDYTRPLEVTWLCPRCHRLEDRSNPKTRIA